MSQKGAANAPKWNECPQCREPDLANAIHVPSILTHSGCPVLDFSCRCLAYWRSAGNTAMSYIRVLGYKHQSVSVHV